MQPEKIGLHDIRPELGRGRKAMVYRGYDPRFEREAKIMAQLEHSASLAPGSLIETMVECYSSSMVFLTSPGP